MTRKNFFDTARAIAGGKLTQAQVDDLNKLVDKFAPSSMTTSDVSIVLSQDLKIHVSKLMTMV